MNIQLSDHFTYKRLLRFTVPTIFMMIFTSIYTVVDGFFVSNFAGKTEFAAINFIVPFIMILGSVGFMFGSGGSAIIAKTLGENKKKDANSYFSLFVYTSFILGIILATVGFFTLEQISYMLGARGRALQYCISYGRICLLAMPAFILQYEFQTYFITAQKPQLGLSITVLAGLTNIILDAIFVGYLRWGVEGAAWATSIGQCIGGIIPIFYFARKNDSLLKLTQTRFNLSILLKTCLNGCSELLTNISISVVAIVFNIQLVSYSGNDGVAAYGVWMYVCMIFLAIFIGYSTGVAPVVSYHYGAENNDELKNLLQKSLSIILISQMTMFILSEALAYPLSKLYVGYDQELLEMTVHCFRLLSFSYFFVGISIFGSAFFTALNNGVVSGTLSFLRTMVYPLVLVFILPRFLGLDGIWLSTVVAEIIGLLTTAYFIARNKTKYSY